MIISKRAKQEAKQLFRSCLVHTSLDENRARDAVQRLVASGYRDCHAILTHFVRLVRLDRARHTANVESATLLPPDLRGAIQAGLARLYGGDLTISFAERSALIGGIRIQVGSDVYDNSVRARLAALQNSF
jgi:F-type H+-transporting ATPase subunit delta